MAGFGVIVNLSKKEVELMLFPYCKGYAHGIPVAVFYIKKEIQARRHYLSTS